MQGDVPEGVDDFRGGGTESQLVLVQLAKDPLLAVGILDVQFAPHIFHHADVVEDLQAVPVDLISRPFGSERNFIDRSVYWIFDFACFSVRKVLVPLLLRLAKCDRCVSLTWRNRSGFRCSRRRTRLRPIRTSHRNRKSRRSSRSRRKIRRRRRPRPCTPWFSPRRCDKSRSRAPKAERQCREEPTGRQSCWRWANCPLRSEEWATGEDRVLARRRRPNPSLRGSAGRDPRRPSGPLEWRLSGRGATEGSSSSDSTPFFGHAFNRCNGALLYSWGTVLIVIGGWLGESANLLDPIDDEIWQHPSDPESTFITRRGANRKVPLPRHGPRQKDWREESVQPYAPVAHHKRPFFFQTRIEKKLDHWLRSSGSIRGQVQWRRTTNGRVSSFRAAAAQL